MKRQHQRIQPTPSERSSVDAFLSRVKVAREFDIACNPELYAETRPRSRLLALTGTSANYPKCPNMR